MPRARDFKIGDLVRMKNAEDQPSVIESYEDVCGHICVVVGFHPFVHAEDCLELRSLGSGRVFQCWPKRVEKYDG